jgi:hypothetical protein
MYLTEMNCIEAGALCTVNFSNLSHAPECQVAQKKKKVSFISNASVQFSTLYEPMHGSCVPERRSHQNFPKIVGFLCKLWFSSVGSVHSMDELPISPTNVAFCRELQLIELG